MRSDVPTTGKAQLAVFDVDGTVISGQSPAIMTVNMLLEGRLKLDEAVKAGLWGLRYKAGLTTETTDVRRRVLGMFKDMPVEQADKIMHEFYLEKITRRVRQKAVDKICWHQSRGDVVLLVSASFEPIVQAIADDLAVVNCASTEMMSENGCYNGEIAGRAVEGEEKAYRVRRYADARFGAGNWEVAYSYADHESDVPVLKMAKHPVAVNPKFKLQVAARRYGWEIQKW